MTIAAFANLRLKADRLETTHPVIPTGLPVRPMLAGSGKAAEGGLRTLMTAP